MAKDTIVGIVTVLLVSGALVLGLSLGFKAGRNKERINIMRILSTMPVDQFSSQTAYHVLYVKAKFYQALREAWK